MAKQAKIKQTDYTKGGRDISNTAIPLYQSNLKRMDEYLQDPQAAMDAYLNKYYGKNAIQNQDFLRQYNRAMGQRTGANYAATGGGYTSSGQRAYDDQQRYYNDLASRLNQYGIGQSKNMAISDYNAMLSANPAYQTAYQQGQSYSNIDQYNDLVDQANNNWWSNAMSAGGKVLSAIPTPWTQAIGAGLQGAGALTSVDTSGAMNAVMGNRNYNYNPNVDTYTNLLNNLSKQDFSDLTNWAKTKYSNFKTNQQNQQTGLNLRGIK